MRQLLAALLTGSLFIYTPLTTLAQSQPVGKQVIVRIALNDEKCFASFDTDGELVNGLKEGDLGLKFSKFKSPVSVLNFMAANGYRVSSFTAVPAGTNRYGGGGMHYGIYVVLFEQLSRP